MHHRRLDGSPGGSWSVSKAAWGRFWAAPCRSWSAKGVPRSTLGRHLGVPEPSRARPDASPKQPWVPKMTQDRFFVNFWSIWGGFSSIFDQFFVAFSFAVRTFWALCLLLPSASFLCSYAASAHQTYLRIGHGTSLSPVRTHKPT